MTHEPAARLLQPSQCALLVIDLQERLMPAIFEAERVLKNATLLLKLAGVLDLPVLLTTQYAQGLGPTLAAITREAPGVTPVDKLEFGGFGSEAFCRRLGELPAGRRTLLVAGIESHICVTQTVLGARSQGLNAHVAADAVSSRTAFNWEIGIERMRAAGAVISSTEMIIYELLGRSGGDAFKRMLPFLKP